MASNTRKQLENYLKTIDVSGSVIDIGNAQQGLSGRTKSWNPKEYIGLDLEKPHKGKQVEIVCDINHPLEFE